MSDTTLPSVCADFDAEIGVSSDDGTIDLRQRHHGSFWITQRVVNQLDVIGRRLLQLFWSQLGFDKDR